MGEFDLIQRYFAKRGATVADVRLGMGDDCAVLVADGSTDWTVTTDMLVEGVHFLVDVDPASLAHKALAVNLSDLAACGAQPRCFFLALGLPRADESWLAAFADGLFLLASQHDCMLAGGDTTRSPSGVTICITALGKVATGEAIRRTSAGAGDELWVSGTLGDAALGLAIRRGKVSPGGAVEKMAIGRLERPVPRVELGQRLIGCASAAIDVSDGLLGDLRHLCDGSGLSAVVRWDDVPRSAGLRGLQEPLEQELALTGGDDYELLFSAPPTRLKAVLAAATEAGTPVSRIGSLAAGSGIRVVDRRGRLMDIPGQPFDHFRA